MGGDRDLWQQHVQISAPDGLVRVFASIGPDTELVSLWSAPTDVEAIHSISRQNGWATFPDVRTPHPVSVTMRRQHTEYEFVTRIADLPLAFPMVQPMPGGQALIVGTRCRWRPFGPDLNAIRYDADGRQMRAAVPGRRNRAYVHHCLGRRVGGLLR